MSPRKSSDPLRERDASWGADTEVAPRDGERGPLLPEPQHLLIDALMAAADALQTVSISQGTAQGRVSSAAYWLRGLDERGFVLIRDPRKDD